jgi:3-oxoacyl-[acyl-carrier-protein] synthase-3
MIELGQIRAGLVVGTEAGRGLVENTIDRLNQDHAMTRARVKTAVASLTIGSASCAILLVHRDLSQTDNRLLGAALQANTDGHQLCHSGDDEAATPSMRPWMETDSERLMHEGIATGATAFERFLRNLGWTRQDIDRTFCHQVGVAHQKLMFERLALNPEIDYATFPWLGNTGSAALPVTMALGAENGHLRAGDNVAMLGIGSGINCLMLAVRINSSRISAN